MALGRRGGGSRAIDYYRGEIACTFIMQPPQLATLDMGVSLPIFNGLREERWRSGAIGIIEVS